MATLICFPFQRASSPHSAIATMPLLAVSILLGRSSSMAGGEGKGRTVFLFGPPRTYPNEDRVLVKKRPFNGLRTKAFGSRLSRTVSAVSNHGTHSESPSAYASETFVASRGMEFNESLSPRILGLCHFWTLEWWGQRWKLMKLVRQPTDATPISFHAP